MGQTHTDNYERTIHPRSATGVPNQSLGFLALGSNEDFLAFEIRLEIESIDSAKTFVSTM